MADRLMIERLRFHRGTASASEATMPGPWSGWWLGIVTLRRPEWSVRWTRFEHHRDPGRPRSFDRLARCAAGCFKSRERLAHDPGAALGQGDQILTQPLDVLLYREAMNFAVTIPEPGARPVAPKELRLDHQRRVARPAGDPNEVLVSGDGAVDQHHRRRTSAIFVDEPTAEIEQHDSEIPINDQPCTQPVDQERTRLIARQDTLDLLLLGFAPEPAHGPNHRQRVVAEGLHHQRPFELALAVSLVRLRLRRELFGGQRDGFGQVLYYRL